MTTAEQELAHELVADCDVMVLAIGRFGGAIPIAAIERLTFGRTHEDLLAIAEAHRQLSALVAPATPMSLRVTAVETNAWGLIRNVPLLRLVLGLGAFFTVAYIICLVTAEAQVYEPCHAQPILVGKPDAPTRIVVPGTVMALKQLAYACAAGLGAVFYTLFTMHRYLVAGTYDVRYTIAYFTRIPLGMIAGVVLANFFASESFVPTVMPTTLALLGGYGADAVNRLLRSAVDGISRLAGHTDSATSHTPSAAEAVRIHSRDAIAEGVAEVPALPPLAETSTPASTGESGSGMDTGSSDRLKP
ncbi:MAG: hypothetical protein KGO50_14945 [Myxococcales bacterium]|nr:hypothetical protein [Myxococcales bacterium]